MKKSLLLAALLIVSVVLNVILFAGEKKLRKKVDVYRFSNISKEYNIQLNHGRKVNDISFRHDSIGFHLSQFVTKDYIIVFRIPEGSCTTCIDVLMPDVNEFTSTIGEEDYLFLIDSETPNGRRTFAKKYDMPLAAVKELTSPLNFPFDNYNLPYAFVIDSNLSVKYFFIPSNDDSTYNRYILQFIKSNFLRLINETFCS